MSLLSQLSTVNLGVTTKELLAVSITFLTLTWIPVLMRLWHPEDLQSLFQIGDLIRNLVAFTGAYIITTIVLKVSLALFFLRIIIDKRHRMIIYVCLGTYTVFGLVYFFINVFRCGTPTTLVFLEHELAGKCIGLHQVIVPASYAQTALNGLIDWIYAILGLITLWSLNMPKVTKMWAGILLGLGAIGSIASLVRIRYVSGLEPTVHIFITAGHLALWSVIENGLGIAAVSLATLRPLFARCLGSARNTYLTPSRRTRTVGSTNHRGSMDDPIAGNLGARAHIQAAPRMSISDDGSEVELAQVTVKTDIEKTYE
ncbi:hypothetical protein MBLNU459_g6055t1 [Dothideomycetes sp. NU459]